MNERNTNQLNPVKILWVSPRWLLPISDGARQATDRLLKLTGEIENAKLDLLIWNDRLVNKKEEDLLKNFYGLNEVWVVTRFLFWLPKFVRSPIFFLLSFIFRVPASVFHFFSLKIHLKNFNGWSKSYDYIIFDAPHGAVSFIRPFTNKFYSENLAYVFRAHNLEFQIWNSESKKHPWILKELLRIQALWMRSFEKLIACKSKIVACVSSSDLKLFQKCFKISNVMVIPIGYHFNDEQDSSASSLVDQNRSSFNWGFLGKLDWPPNEQGLIWFLKEVWSEALQNSDISLVIAGSGQPSSEMEALIKQPRIKYLGYVEDVRDFYREVDGVVVPIFYGGGTRVKAIEAGRFHKLILSSRLGVKGLNLIPSVDYIRAETSEEWKKLLVSQKTNSDFRIMTFSCFKKLRVQFDPESFKDFWFRIFQ